MTKYGYVRVSSKDQNPDRQIVAMKEYGVKEENIFLDKVSGKNFNRPAYKKLLKKLCVGDLVVIKSIDRLGRNYKEIVNEWNYIAETKKVDIHVIDMQLLNTNVAHGDLTGKLIANMVLQIMAYVAETERDFIRQRQKEGIVIAKNKGIKFGAKRKEVPMEFEQYFEKWKNREVTVREAALYLGITPSLFYRRCNERIMEIKP